MKTYVIVSDIHVPFHDTSYLAFVRRLVTKIKPDGIVQLGDALDFFQVSSYPKDPTRKNTIEDDAMEYIGIVKSLLKVAPKGCVWHQLEGNHEHRLSRYIATSAPAIHGMTIRLSRLFKDHIPGLIWHDYMNWKSCRLGDCTLMHGFYYNQHVAHGCLSKYKRNVIFGHTHRFQYLTDGDHYACTLGHGSNEALTAHQPTPTGWTQACGVLTVLDSGKTSFQPILVHDGKGMYGSVKI
jgi:predicted phosphodiesterase